MVEKKTNNDSHEFSVEEVPTQVQEIIKNNTTGETLNISNALALILNQISELNKRLS